MRMIWWKNDRFGTDKYFLPRARSALSKSYLVISSFAIVYRADAAARAMEVETVSCTPDH